MGDSPQQTKADTAERDSALTQGLRSLALGSQPQMQSGKCRCAILSFFKTDTPQLQQP
jgi:hypothetical protein